MDNCIFCSPEKVSGGTFYEDDDLYAVLSTEPFSYGHSIVIPKKHFKFFHEIDSGVMSRINNALPKIIQVILEATECKGYNVVINNGFEANQTISHVHIHVIPRYNISELEIRKSPFDYLSGAREKLLGKLEELCDDKI